MQRGILQSIAAFFHGEGSGLSNADMKTPRSVQFRLMLDNHSCSRLDLESKFLAFSTSADFFTETEDGLCSTDWILKLLKAKGHHDSVEKGLKARAAHQVLKSFSL
jgi:hypothetical protein